MSIPSFDWYVKFWNFYRRSERVCAKMKTRFTYTNITMSPSDYRNTLMKGIESRIDILTETLSKPSSYHRNGSTPITKSSRKPLAKFQLNTFDLSGRVVKPEIPSREKSTKLNFETRIKADARTTLPRKRPETRKKENLPRRREDLPRVEQLSRNSTFFDNPSKPLSLDDFELGRILGKGKLGKVYCAKHISSDYIVALKIMSKKELVELKLEKNFRREIEIQSHLVHSKISRLYGFFHDSKNVYLILEYSIYGELYHHLKVQKRFNDIMASFYISQVAQALIYLHSKNVIHRDIKPENILLSYHNTVKLSDFGWSVQTKLKNDIHRHQRLTFEGRPTDSPKKRLTICGTLDYLPPEMIESDGHDHSVDNWSLGILCYEFLVGKPPFEEVDKNATYKRIAKVDLRFPSYIDPDAKEMMISLLQKEPSKRLKLEKVLVHPWITKNKSYWPNTGA